VVTPSTVGINFNIAYNVETNDLLSQDFGVENFKFKMPHNTVFSEEEAVATLRELAEMVSEIIDVFEEMARKRPA